MHNRKRITFKAKTTNSRCIFKKKYGDTNKTIMSLIGEKQERSQSHTVNYKHRVIVPYSGILTEKLRKIYHKNHIRLVARSTHVIKTRLNKGVHKRSCRSKRNASRCHLSCYIITTQKVYIG